MPLAVTSFSLPPKQVQLVIFLAVSSQKTDCAAYSPMSGPTYAASKAGSVGVMRALRNFLPPLKIRLNWLVTHSDKQGSPIALTKIQYRSGIY